MFDYGRRRCCTGVYMLDAENFESIVAELKSEETTCAKMRSRGQNGSGSGHGSGGGSSHNEKRSNGANNGSSNQSRKAHGNDGADSQSKGSQKGEKGHHSSRKGHSYFGGSSKSGYAHGDEKAKSDGAHAARSGGNQGNEEKPHKGRGDVLNNKRNSAYSKEYQQHAASSGPAAAVVALKMATTSSDASSDPPVRWIKNNLTEYSADNRKGSDCKSCRKEPTTGPAVSKLTLAPTQPKLEATGLGLSGVSTLAHSSILCQQQNTGSIHSLIHYTTGKPILLYDYSEDACPVCHGPQPKQLHHPIPGQQLAHGESPNQSSQPSPPAHPPLAHHPLSQHPQSLPHQQLPKPQTHGISSSSFMPSVRLSDFVDIASKTCTHPQVNLNAKCCSSHFEVKPSVGNAAVVGLMPEASLAYQGHSGHHHPCLTTASHTSTCGSCCICPETRCSQCVWSQFFYDSYYRVYYMYPQQNPHLSMMNSVYVDLTSRNFTLTIERPQLDEDEVRCLTEHLKCQSGSVDKPYMQSCTDVTTYEDKSRSTVWPGDSRPEHNSHFSSTFPSGPLVCISLPSAKKRLFPYSNACLVPPLSFVDYYGSTPPDRTWRPLNEPVNGAIQFTLMCYNILCEKYASQQVYPYCPTWALSWLFRRTAILDEIRLYTADIICLQEVEMDQYEGHFEKILKAQGYSGIFSPKSRAHHMTDAERRKVDGCAIFWKNERFRLVKDAVIEFSRMAMERYENDCKESPEMLNRVMVRDNIALSAILETKESNHPQQFMVSTAHIHWDPEYSDVKLIQSIMHVSSLYQKIEEHLLEQNGGNGPVYPLSMPLIVCGDFNSLPQSGVVEFLTQGRVAKSHPDFKNLGYVKVLDKLCGRRRHGRGPVDHDVLQHDFVLGRAYDSGEGMRYTNYTYDFKGIIDYIFYTKNHFNLLGNLEMVSEGWLKKEKVPGCPHPHIPSDHFPLLVELELQLPNERSGDHHGLMSRK